MRASATLLAVSLLFGATKAWAEDPARVPLSEGFSRAEIATLTTATVAGTFLLVFGHAILDPPVPSLGAPADGSWDRRVSDALYFADGGSGRFLGGVPAFAGIYVLPFAPAAYYAAALWRDRPGRDPNLDHRLLAYVEALGFTVLVTSATKYLVGRPRPFIELAHPELRSMNRSEDNLSFFSGHSSAMFCAASFVARDAGGVLVPALAYGAASVVALSRVIDQQHWASDVGIGALVGSLIAHLVWTTHFDQHGNPQRRFARDVATRLHLVPTGSGIAVAGGFP